MGARPSRRQMTEARRLALTKLPPELLVQVLSHVPPRALVTRCRPVCRAWRDLVDGPSIWLLQLARDRSAEGRALYALAQRCPADADADADGNRHDEFPFCALARFCLRAPFGRNLIHNSCGERGYRGQGLASGGGASSWWVGPDPWRVESAVCEPCQPMKGGEKAGSKTWRPRQGGGRA